MDLDLWIKGLGFGRAIYVRLAVEAHSDRLPSLPGIDDRIRIF